MFKRIWDFLLGNATEVDYVDVKMTADSRWFKEFHNKKNVFTFFYQLDPDDNKNQVLYKKIHTATLQCFGKSITYGRPDYPGHDDWHIRVEDSLRSHWHLIVKNFQRVSPEAFNCYWNKINIIQTTNGQCMDGVTNCLITADDIKKTSISYQQFYEDKWLEKQFSVAANAFLHGFLTTLIKKYVAPHLIEKNVDSDVVIIMTEVINFIIGGMLFGWLNIAYFTAAQQLTDKVIKQCGLDHWLIDAIKNASYIALVAISNPTYLFDFVTISSAALAGTTCAHFTMAIANKATESITLGMR